MVEVNNDPWQATIVASQGGFAKQPAPNDRWCLGCDPTGENGDPCSGCNLDCVERDELPYNVHPWQGG
jgi:hypothetical protein